MEDLDEPYLFHYRKCCRIHKLVAFERIGPCGLCGKVPEQIATYTEYCEQPRLETK